jgi:5'-nucleotidase
MKRFILVTLLTGLLSFSAACLPPPEVQFYPGQGHITILHSNDTHATLDDVARRAALVNQVRKELGPDKMLLLDAGDVFAGTPYFTLFKGQADLRFMNSMAYDAMGVGGHEFDLGPAGLAPFIEGAKFPLISANLDAHNEPALKGKISPWTVITRDGVKYGLFGLTSLDTQNNSRPGPNVTFTNPLQAARSAVSALQAKDVRCIIALSQLGWDLDLELARQVGGIDVIVGGHSHTVPEKYPTVITTDAPPTLVVQAGAYNQYLGRLDVRFDREGVIQVHTGVLMRIDSKVEPDAAAQVRLAEYKGPVDALMAQSIGRTAAALDGDRARLRSQETNLGDLVADAFLAQAAPQGAVLAMVNSGAIRASVPAGSVSLGQVMAVLPMAGMVTRVELTGQQVIDALENGVGMVEQGNGRFLQVSGLRYTWDPVAHTGKRIVKVEVGKEGSYAPIDPKATYAAVVNDWIAGGGDGFSMVKQGRNIQDTGVFDRDALAEYIKARGTVEGKTEGRIVRAGS